MRREFKDKFFAFMVKDTGVGHNHMHPMSVLLICQTYPPVIGGSEIEAQRVCEGLIARGHHMQVVCAGGHPMPPVRDWVDPKGVPVRIYAAGRKGKMRDRIFALRVAGMLIRERKNYEVAYFLMHGLHLAVGLPVARMLRKPIVMKIACSGVISEMRKSLVGRMELFFLKRWAARILVLNPGMMEEALKEGFDKGKISWMPNPVDTDYFRPVATNQRGAFRKELNIPEDASLVVFIGRLHSQKKIPWMLRGFARVAQERPRAMLALIGDGPLRSEIRALVRLLNIEDKVIFAGAVSTDTVLKWNQVADICALVSEVEGLPCSLIESMSAGVPPVLSNIPAHTQLVENEVHGLITEVGDEESIARGLQRTIDDRELRDRMSAAARQRMIDVYSTAKVVDRYESLFSSALDGNRRPDEVLAVGTTSRDESLRTAFAASKERERYKS